MSKKISVVTGAAGFIGSHLVERLLSEGFRVIGVDNLITGREKNIQHLLSSNSDSSFKFIKADVSESPEKFLSKVGNIEIFFHFASPASPKSFKKMPEQIYRVNSFATHNLLKHIALYHPKARFIFASTSEVYGDPQVHPQPEEYWGNVNPNGPRSCYDESKRFGEMVCGVFNRQHSLDTRVLRIFNTYGPRINPGDGRIIPNFIRQALSNQDLTVYGDGKQTRSYCFVSDLVEGIVKFALKDGLAGETVNIGNPDEHSVIETAEVVARLVGGNHQTSFLALPPDDPVRRKPDISKAKKLLSWEPHVTFEEGLSQTIEYFKKHETF